MIHMSIFQNCQLHPLILWLYIFGSLYINTFGVICFILKIIESYYSNFAMNIEKRFFSEIEMQSSYSPKRNAVFRTLLWFHLVVFWQHPFTPLRERMGYFNFEKQAQRTWKPAHTYFQTFEKLTSRLAPTSESGGPKIGKVLRDV